MSDPAALHHSLLTLDSHVDIPWPDRDDAFTESPRCVDIPKLRRGGVGVVCLAAYVPQRKRDEAGHQAAFDRAVAMLETIGRLARADGAVVVRLAGSADAIEAAHREGAIAVVPAVENGYAMGTDLARLRAFRDAGARYLTLTHNGHNALSDSSNPRADLGDAAAEHGGLSALGRSAVAELNRLGLLVDVSHVSRDAMLQAAELSRAPVVATHSSIRALCDNARNLDDGQLDALRACGGLVQITAVPSFLRGGGKADTVGVADYVDHVDHAVRRIGVEHVGISSDFDGGGGIAGWRNAAESANLTAELWRRGYGRAEIGLLWGGNFLRLMRAAERIAQ